MQKPNSAAVAAGILLGLLGLASAADILRPQYLDDGIKELRNGLEHSSGRKLLYHERYYFRDPPMAFRDASGGGSGSTSASAPANCPDYNGPWTDVSPSHPHWLQVQDATAFAIKVFQTNANARKAASMGREVKVLGGSLTNLNHASYKNAGGSNLLLVKLQLVLFISSTRSGWPVDVLVLLAHNKPQWMDYKCEQYSPETRQGGQPQWVNLDNHNANGNFGLWLAAQEAAKFAVQVIATQPDLQQVLFFGTDYTFRSLDHAEIQVIEENPQTILTAKFRITFTMAIRMRNGFFRTQKVHTVVLFAGGEYRWADLGNDQWPLGRQQS